MAAVSDALTMVSTEPAFPKLAGQNPRYLFKQLKDMKSGVRPVPMMAAQLETSGETLERLQNLELSAAIEEVAIITNNLALKGFHRFQ